MNDLAVAIALLVCIKLAILVIFYRCRYVAVARQLEFIDSHRHALLSQIRESNERYGKLARDYDELVVDYSYLMSEQPTNTQY